MARFLGLPFFVGFSFSSALQVLFTCFSNDIISGTSRGVHHSLCVCVSEYVKLCATQFCMSGCNCCNFFGNCNCNGHGSPASAAAATTATGAVVATCKPVEQRLIYSLVATG